jgi:hypothetical protein
MTDIDFEELDKAVNSLMKKAPDDSAEPAAPSATEAAPSLSLPEATAATGVAISVTNKTEPPASAPMPALKVAPRQNGKFMDLVPSSSRPLSRSAASTASREGVTIAPRPADEVKPKIAETETTPEPSPMPDPIDLAQTNDPTESSESPFIADAKVEKRPLNAGATTAPDLVMNEDVVAEPVEVAPEDTPTPMPEELESDIVAVESSELVEDKPAAADTANTDAMESPVINNRLDENSSGPTGPASIVQQYKEQPSSGDQSHAAIYDTSNFAQPLSHPAKKSAGWLWILWVVLLLGVGAGAAYALNALGIIP